MSEEFRKPAGYKNINHSSFIPITDSTKSVKSIESVESAINQQTNQSWWNSIIGIKK